ncbi:MAG: hypothetical protein II555_04140, partial [Bacteroidales bacterium]|nr:hypothetical protein [Bacteroidales bacterium]
PFCYFLEGGRKGNNFFPSVQGGRYFSSSFAGKKILFQPMFSLKKLRFLLELIGMVCFSPLFEVGWGIYWRVEVNIRNMRKLG